MLLPANPIGLKEPLGVVWTLKWLGFPKLPRYSIVPRVFGKAVFLGQNHMLYVRLAFFWVKKETKWICLLD